MCFSLRRKDSTHGSYVLRSKLRGHSGGIVRLRATEDGRFLASGGTDGTKVWDLSTMRELGSPKSPEIRGASTALVWIKREDDLSEALFYGTQNGQLGLAVFEEISCVRVTNPAEITGLAFDAPSNRLAVCHRGGMVQVYLLGSTMSLQEVFTLELKNLAPRAIAFGQMYGNERDVMVFGLYGGDIYTLRGSNGKVTGEPWNVGAFIGDIALDTRKGVLCMDDPSLGANLYRLEDHKRVKTFPVAVTKQKRLRQVDFGDECKSIVSGSDHGIVYVFDRRSGDIVDELKVDPREWVQTVAAADCAGVPTIFAAKSRDLVGMNDIFVWRRQKTQRRFGVASMACGMLIFLQLFFIVAAVAFVFQNLAILRIKRRAGNRDLWAYNAPQRQENAKTLPTYNVVQWGSGPAGVQRATAPREHQNPADSVKSVGRYHHCPTLYVGSGRALMALWRVVRPQAWGAVTRCTPADPPSSARTAPSAIPIGARRFKNPRTLLARTMSSQSYHSASRGSRTSKTSHQPTYHYHGFCRQCDICPTCGSSPPTARMATAVPAPTPEPARAPPAPPTPPGSAQAPVVPMNERILPQLPVQFFVTLFLLESQLTGDWRHLIIPYAACLIVFYL
ncbi:WD40-repeat-containing domain protein [Mycena haematopus]|nr:WD40-repeat-containing domain protein [Mycena haematopus]